VVGYVSYKLVSYNTPRAMFSPCFVYQTVERENLKLACARPKDHEVNILAIWNLLLFHGTSTNQTCMSAHVIPFR